MKGVLVCRPPPQAQQASTALSPELPPQVRPNAIAVSYVKHEPVHIFQNDVAVVFVLCHGDTGVNLGAEIRQTFAAILADPVGLRSWNLISLHAACSNPASGPRSLRKSGRKDP